MSAHTPGPWGVFQEVPGAPCIILANTEFGRGSIASTLEVANARLIAAAPELYEALEAAADALDEEQIAAGGDDHPVLVRHARIANAARAALAKAEGK